MLLLVVAAFVVAIVTDLREGKIRNWLTFPLLALVLAWSFHEGGLVRLENALAAALFTFFLLLPKAGAGDLKLSAAVGAYLGWPACTFFVAAIYSIRLLIVLVVRVVEARGSVRRLWSILLGEISKAATPVKYPGAPVLALGALVAWLLSTGVGRV